MPSNKRESFVFTVLMCSFMVFIMSIYNVLRMDGFSAQFMQRVILGFPLAFGVGFIADWFVVGPGAKKIASNFIDENDHFIKKIVLLSSFIVLGMVIVMSLFGSVMGVGISEKTFFVWLVNIPYNLMVALPLQLLIAGPFVRFCFGKIYRTA